ncbi:MAG: ATP-binding protein [Pseudomonadota bacterium]
MSETGPIDLMKKVLLLTSRIYIPLSEEELLKGFAESIIESFPTSRCCIRLIDPESGSLLNSHAVGIMDEEMREHLFITPDSFEGGEIPRELGKKLSPNIHVHENAKCIFKRSRSCVVVAIAHGSEFYGTIHVETSGKPSFLPRGKLFLFVVGTILASAVANYRYLGELRYLHDYMSKLIEHANVPIVVLDESCRVKFYNKAMEEVTGCDRKDIAGRDFFNLLKDDDRLRFKSVMNNAFKGKATAGFELHMPRDEGRSSVPMALNVAPVVDRHGKTRDAVVIGQDLTEVRRLQNQMLQTERLMTIGQLSAGVVHEINNPLTSVSVYSEYLLKKYEKQGMEKGDLTRIKRIVDAADRILRFTKALMNYSRPMAEEPSLVDLREIATHAIGFCEHIIAGFNVTIHKDFPDDLPPVYGIRAQLEQIFVNLITNACHAMKAEGGELRVRIKDNRDGTVLTELEDSGSGMPDDVASKAFEPFFTTKVEGEGTGLGLSIVKNIVDNHDGQITIRSRPGRGTTVSFWLYTLE